MIQSPMPSSGFSFADLTAGMEAFQAFANAYDEDPDLRSRVDTDPKAVLAELGVETPSGVELCISVNTNDTFYLVLPPDPNAVLADEMLGQVAGGKSVSTMGSVGSGGSVGSLCTTASTGSTASSVGCAGSANL